MDLHRFSAFDYMKLVVGSALVAAAFQFFTFPNSIVSGGVTGIAQIIRLLTGIPVGVLSILINIPIFYLGWRHRLGTRRLVLALCVMALISVLIDALALTGLVVTDEPMLGAVYGGVLNGAGYGLIYTTGTTGGGTDIVAKMLRRRYPYINFGTLLRGEGAWSGKEMQVILCVVKRPEIAQLREVVRSVDEHAFVIVSEAKEVFGRGFGNIYGDD